jgi:hypothetical protein
MEGELFFTQSAHCHFNLCAFAGAQQDAKYLGFSPDPLLNVKWSR